MIGFKQLTNKRIAKIFVYPLARGFLVSVNILSCVFKSDYGNRMTAVVLFTKKDASLCTEEPRPLRFCLLKEFAAIKNPDMYKYDKCLKSFLFFSDILQETYIVDIC